MNPDLSEQSFSPRPVSPALLLVSDDAPPMVTRPAAIPVGNPAAQNAAAAVCRYLRHRVTQEYYRAGGWTSDIREAQTFTDVIQASRTCVREQLTEVEVVLRLSGGVDDLFCTSLC